MRVQPPYPLEHVDQMIDFLDKAITAGKDTPALLHGLQKRLDAINGAYRNDPRLGAYYARMLELQSLIYGRQNQDMLAMKFMKEAIRQAGSVRALRSKQIRQYVTEHAQQAAATPSPRTSRQAMANEAVANVKPKRRKSRLFGRGKKKAIVVAAMILVVMLGAGAVYSPQTFGLTMLTKYSQINAAKNTFDNLKAQYDSCSSTLSQEKGSISSDDISAVDAYNKAAANCQSIFKQESKAASYYNGLIGKK